MLTCMIWVPSDRYKRGWRLGRLGDREGVSMGVSETVFEEVVESILKSSYRMHKQEAALKMMVQEQGDGTMSRDAHEIYWPDMPPVQSGRSVWSAEVHSAYDLLDGLVSNAVGLLAQEDADPVQIQHHHTAITEQALPLLEVLEKSAEELPLAWLSDCAEYLGVLTVALQESGRDASLA
ncbi:hypothetical protein EIP86_004407 [Pleurotus ostreatoroseus]|nr:hypothetical protein EIP86_004407 [Pleurotus ostreatoroseus]